MLFVLSIAATIFYFGVEKVDLRPLWLLQSQVTLTFLQLHHLVCFLFVVTEKRRKESSHESNQTSCALVFFSQMQKGYLKQRA